MSNTLAEICSELVGAFDDNFPHEKLADFIEEIREALPKDPETLREDLEWNGEC